MELVAAEKQAESLFRRHKGVLRTSRAIKLGIHPRTLYRLRDSGHIVHVSRGVYRLADQPEEAARLKEESLKEIDELSATIKANKLFKDSPLVRQGRLSVVPLTEEQFAFLTHSYSRL